MPFNPPPIKDGWADTDTKPPRTSWAVWFQSIWTLLNNTTNTATSGADTRYGSAMFPFTVAQASNLLTGTLAPCKVDFRATALTTGTPVEYNVAANLTLAMTSIAGSLGSTSAVPTRLAWAIVYAAGTPQIAVANMFGGLQMDESNLITTTAIGAGSTSATTWYSTSAIGTPSQYRIVGFSDATWTNGVGWSTPTTVQPMGGLFLSSMGGAVLARPGYQKFPSGLLLQWGNGLASVAGTVNTFPIPFPNACFWVGYQNINQTNPPTGQVSGLTTTGFTATVSAGGPSIIFLAVGF